MVEYRSWKNFDYSRNLPKGMPFHFINELMRPREIRQLAHFVFFPWLVTEFRYIYRACIWVLVSKILVQEYSFPNYIFLDGIKTWLFFWKLCVDPTLGIFFPLSPWSLVQHLAHSRCSVNSYGINEPMNFFFNPYNWRRGTSTEENKRIIHTHN